MDSSEELSELSQFDNSRDFHENYDKTIPYLSKEEISLPEEDRNQLALDRYIESQKSK